MAKEVEAAYLFFLNVLSHDAYTMRILLISIVSLIIVSTTTLKVRAVLDKKREEKKSEILREELSLGAEGLILHVPFHDSPTSIS